MLRRILLGGVSGMLIFVVSSMHAQEGPTVVLNEVFYDAVGSDTGHEWIELFNAGGATVDLGGWHIQRGGLNFSSVFTFPPDTTVPPGTFLVVGESLVEEADLITTLSLQNGGSATDGVRLIDAAGSVVDVVLYDSPNLNALPDETGSPGTSFAPDVSAGHSLARIPDGVDTNDSAADFTDVASPTPGSSNAPPTPTPTPTPPDEPTFPPAGTVVINDVFPNPVGADAEGEFVELRNTSGETVDLSGWKLDDIDGGSTPYTIPDGVAIDGNALKVFERSETNLAFNNDEDSARLIDPVGAIHASTSYEGATQGESWSRRDDGSYVWTTTITKGTANVFTSADSGSDESSEGEESSSTKTSKKAKKGTVKAVAVTKTSVAGARTVSLGTQVEIEGVISAPPGVLGSQIAYVRGSGMQLFLSKGWPDLDLGDQVRVTGEVREAQGERRIGLKQASDITRIMSGSAPEPIEIMTGDVGEAYEGQLVRVSGAVTRTAGKTFYISDGSGDVKIVVKTSTGIDKPTTRKGTMVTVTGIVSQTSSGYRILPRFQEDLIVGTVAGLRRLPATGNPRTREWITLAMFGMGIVAFRRAIFPMHIS